MEIIYLQESHIENMPLAIFLLNIEQTLNDIKHKNNKEIVVFGTGLEGYIVKQALEKQGIIIDKYCSNNDKQWGQEIESCEILSPYFVMDNASEYYLIVAVEKDQLSTVRAQLYLNGVENYSIMLHEKFIPFSSNKEVISLYIDTINQLINIYDKQELLSLPIVGTANESMIQFLIESITWWSPVLKYLLQNLKINSNVLEIGPGYGNLMATIISTFPNLSYDILSYAGYRRTLKTSKYIKEKYNKSLHQVIHGEIEDPSLMLPHKYDFIILTEVFEHFVCNPVQTMMKIKSFLTLKGKICLTTPNWGRIHTYKSWKDMPKFEEFETKKDYFSHNLGHNYQYNKDELLEIFQSSGFFVDFYELSSRNNHNFVLSIR
ncbi:methyltransferase domain-containing protein [Paenibacillus xylanexedens]|uniref:SAM-dependent methyltransferase n=1 Tax=Paenibacillus xylanexedens TaxID=528191 RepID=A0ABS4RSZ4_PAEXY|nr:methyltransferase domain-containing protein [Paenibacillus xylanexedens]MBP2245839.1 SAM-dependent methyltransferase [Paenibacillus xylanexedens]